MSTFIISIQHCPNKNSKCGEKGRKMRWKKRIRTRREGGKMRWREGGKEGRKLYRLIGKE